MGGQDWNKIYHVPENVVMHHVDTFEKICGRSYDLVFLDRTPLDGEIMALYRATRAYTLFVTEQVVLRRGAAWLYQSRKGKRIAQADIQNFLLYEAENYFPVPYGEKFDFKNLAISRNFEGAVRWNGNYSVDLQGDFGAVFGQIAYWRNNIPVFSGQCIDLWLEYRKSPEVSIALSVTQFVKGSVSDVQQTWEFTEQELSQVVRLDNRMEEGPIFVSLRAKGQGNLQIIALHDRYSRRGHGYFLPGGERYVSTDREELFCYFDPGDMKPPLNVYFSGYKTREGFEGYNIMRNMECPFLLIAEARLEGGSFYMGSGEYEQMIADAVRRYMAELDFGPEQVIFSGLSMGTFGALYYGCDIRPRAMILGKPLVSIGNVAANEKWSRPGGFPTSLDVLQYVCGNTDAEAIEKLNAKFWRKFDAADWSQSKFIISYMIEDDYDEAGYMTLLSHLKSDGVQLYGKGIHGRHNDSTPAIINWFLSQYRRILAEDFGRKEKR